MGGCVDECAFAGGGRGESANSGKDSARCVVDCERIGGGKGGGFDPGDKNLQTPLEISNICVNT